MVKFEFGIGELAKEEKNAKKKKNLGLKRYRGGWDGR